MEIRLWQGLPNQVKYVKINHCLFIPQRKKVIKMTHLVAGSLMFLWLGEISGLEIDSFFLFLGGLCGLLPDFQSFFISRPVMSRWSHRHRDNFSHSIFFSLPVFLVLCLSEPQLALPVAGALLTHPLLDLWGIGWGVKLFYPFSEKIFKVFYKDKFLTVFSQEEQDLEARKYGDDAWIKNIYFSWNVIDPLSNPVGFSEWASLIAFTLLLAKYY